MPVEDGLELKTEVAREAVWVTVLVSCEVVWTVEAELPLEESDKARVEELAPSAEEAGALDELEPVAAMSMSATRCLKWNEEEGTWWSGRNADSGSP